MHQAETGHLQEGVREWDFDTVLINAYVMFYFLKKKVKLTYISSKCLACLKYLRKMSYWIRRQILDLPWVKLHPLRQDF